MSSFSEFSPTAKLLGSKQKKCSRQSTSFGEAIALLHFQLLKRSLFAKRTSFENGLYYISFLFSHSNNSCFSCIFGYLIVVVWQAANNEFKELKRVVKLTATAGFDSLLISSLCCHVKFPRRKTLALSRFSLFKTPQFCVQNLERKARLLARSR